MLKLSVAVGMVGAFLRLQVRLQAIAQFMQQIGYHLMTEFVAHSLQLGGQLTYALRSPAERCLRVASRGGFQQ